MELFSIFLGTFVKFAIATIFLSIVVFIITFITAEDFIYNHPMIANLGIIIICLIGIGSCALAKPQFLLPTIGWAIVISGILGLGIGINTLINCILYDRYNTKDIFRARLFEAMRVLGLTVLTVAFLVTLYTSVKTTTGDTEHQISEKTIISTENILDSVDIDVQEFHRVLPNDN